MNSTKAPKKIKSTLYQAGFTLIELLAALAVLGILVAIAIPQFYSYRARATDAQMKSDIKNVAIAMESYYSERFFYPVSVSEITPFGFRQTTGMNILIDVTSPTSYLVTASKPAGSQPSFTYDSVTGQTN